MNHLYKITIQKLNNYKNRYSLRRFVLLKNFANHLSLKDGSKELTLNLEEKFY